jgi:hypothetical protein
MTSPDELRRTSAQAGKQTGEQAAAAKVDRFVRDLMGTVAANDAASRATGPEALRYAASKGATSHTGTVGFFPEFDSVGKKIEGPNADLARAAVAADMRAAELRSQGFEAKVRIEPGTIGKDRGLGGTSGFGVKIDVSWDSNEAGQP